MEACSPGVGNHSRKGKTENNPNNERKKQYKEFNRIMRVGKNIKKDNKGMYALDEIKISYAEAVRAGPIQKPQEIQADPKSKIKITTRFEPERIKDIKLKTSHNGPEEDESRTINEPRCLEKSKSRTINGPRCPEDSKSRTINGPRSPRSNCRALNESLISNCRTVKTQGPIPDGRTLNQEVIRNEEAKRPENWKSVKVERKQVRENRSMQTQERKKKIEVRVKFKPRWIVDLENIKVKESFRTTDKSIKEQTQERKKKIKVKTKFKPKWIEDLKVKMLENNRRVIPKDRIIRTQDSIPYNRINQQRNRDKKENEIKRDGDGRREEYKNREVSNSLIVNGKTRKRKEKVRRLLRVTHKHNPRISKYK